MDSQSGRRKSIGVTFEAESSILDFVRIKLITEKRLYSEEELTSSQKVVQFISKELAECDREVLCI